MTEMGKNYLENYLRALATPLPEMQKTFEEEEKILKKYCKKKVVLDIGCGVGRPAYKLIECSEPPKQICLIDNDSQMLQIAKERISEEKIVFFYCDITTEKSSLIFSKKLFEVAYATYNFIGCLKKNKIKPFLENTKFILNEKGILILTYWKQNKTTTELLKKYYPSIGLSIKKISYEKTITSTGEFKRLSIKQVEKHLKKNGFSIIHSGACGPAWNHTIAQVKNSKIK